MPSHLPAEVRRRLEPIRLLVLDVDGVLTDGTLVYSSRGEETPVQITDFHSVIAFEPQRRVIEDLLATGQKVFIQGRLQYSQDPSTRAHSTRIVCERILILSPPPTAAARAGGEGAGGEKPVVALG